MGGEPSWGLGNDMTRSQFTNSPANDVSSVVHISRNAAMYSSVRCPRRSNGTPSASNSSSNQPTPIPSSTRPFDNASRVATSLASTAGLRCGRINTPVPSLTFDEFAATHVSQMSGSGMGESSEPGILPVEL